VKLDHSRGAQCLQPIDTAGIWRLGNPITL
jgi:hypothetical protein